MPKAKAPTSEAEVVQQPAAAAPQPVKASDLPLIKKPDAPPEGPQLHVGLFNPSVLNHPTHAELIAIILILGLQTRPFAGQDDKGNLVDQKGNVIVPGVLRRFFQNVPVRTNG